MNNKSSNRKPRGTRWCGVAIWTASAGIVLVGAGLAGARLDLLGPMAAFMSFGIGALAFVIALITGIIGLALSGGTAGAASSPRSWAALIVSAIVIGTSLSLRPDSSGASPINDITTDTDNPPLFAQPDYPGEAFASQQRAAFPDLVTLELDEPPRVVFDRAEQLARESGWKITAADPESGRIVATDTTTWFRFKDDIVIRLTPTARGTAVDIRSRSRVGRGDMGTNARRIRGFLGRLRPGRG